MPPPGYASPPPPPGYYAPPPQAYPAAPGVPPGYPPQPGQSQPGTHSPFFSPPIATSTPIHALFPSSHFCSCSPSVSLAAVSPATGKPYPPGFRPNLFQELLEEDRRREALKASGGEAGGAVDVVDVSATPVPPPQLAAPQPCTSLTPRHRALGEERKGASGRTAAPLPCHTASHRAPVRWSTSLTPPHPQPSRTHPSNPPAPISLCAQTRPTPPLGLAPPLLAAPCLPFPSPAPLPHDRSPSPLPRVRRSRARQRRGASRHALRGPGRTTRPRRRSSSGCSANTHVRLTERGARRGMETHHALDDREWEVTGLSGTHLVAPSLFVAWPLPWTSHQLLTRSLLVWP